MHLPWFRVRCKIRVLTSITGPVSLLRFARARAFSTPSSSRASLSSFQGGLGQTRQGLFFPEKRWWERDELVGDLVGDIDWFLSVRAKEKRTLTTDAGMCIALGQVTQRVDCSSRIAEDLLSWKKKTHFFSNSFSSVFGDSKHWKKLRFLVHPAREDSRKRLCPLTQKVYRHCDHFVGLTLKEIHSGAVRSNGNRISFARRSAWRVDSAVWSRTCCWHLENHRT